MYVLSSQFVTLNSDFLGGFFCLGERLHPRCKSVYMRDGLVTERVC